MNYALSDFDFELPEQLIAQHPLTVRRASRLFRVEVATQTFQHQQFTHLIDWINPGDILVVNDTKVIPARLLGQKVTGGKIECLIERILSPRSALAQIRASKAPKEGTALFLAAGAIKAVVAGRLNDLFILEFEGETDVLEQLMQYGQVPLPSYIKRNPEGTDIDRYQTIFASDWGAVAAPTAGLHFDQFMLDQLKQKGVIIHAITLHVGAGTFVPVRHEDLDQHSMHSEYFKISKTTCQAIQQAKSTGKRIIAVGTTVVRCLESAALSGELLAQEGETRIFIRPGFQFKVIDALLTNFHLPKSSLMILVSAFAGYELIMRSYQEAIKENYRFFSYGDAMLINRAFYD